MLFNTAVLLTRLEGTNKKRFGYDTLWKCKINYTTSCMVDYMSIHEQSTNHISLKIALDVIQSHPLRRTCFGQYQASIWGDWEMGTATCMYLWVCMYVCRLAIRIRGVVYAHMHETMLNIESTIPE